MRVDGELGKSERKWLLEVDRMLDFDDLGLLGVFTRDELVAAEQAFLLLVAR